MARATLPPLQRQIIRVRRRLLAQGLLDSLACSWTASLVLAACWFAAQPHVIPSAPSTLRWIVAGSLLLLATVVAVVYAAFRRPSPVATALAVDERFGLKERVTTSVMLPPADVATPAASALLDDVNNRLAKVPVAERFPVRLTSKAWLVPSAGAALALVAIFYKPAIVTPTAAAVEQLAATPEVKDEIAKKMDQLRKKKDDQRPDDKNRSAELERLEADLEKISRQPHDTKEQAREIVKDLTGIEEQIKKRQQELAQRSDALKEQMKQVSRLSKRNNNDGPAKQLNQALERGDLQKAKEELDRLGKQLKAEEEADRLNKKLQDQGLSKEERDKTQERLNQLKSERMSKQDRDNLGKQMRDIKEKVQRLSRKKEEKEKALRDQAQKGELSKEQLQRELDRLEKDADKLSDKDLDDLKDLADKMDKAEKSLEEGNDLEAAQQLEDAANQLEGLDRELELQELAEKLEDCEGCKGMMGDALDGHPVPSAGRRPESKDTVTSSVEKRERLKMDKGKLRLLDTVPGEGFRGPKKPAELTEEIRRASQEAPEAIDRQRLPRSAGNMAKGYFEKLRGDRDKPDKP